MKRNSVLVALLTIGFLVAGIGIALRQTRPPGAGTPAGEVDPDDSTLVARALAEIPEDSTAIKQGWVDEVRGIEVAMLSPERLERFVRFANARQCTCGCGFTLAACRQYDLTCPVSQPAAEALRDSIAAGFLTDVVRLRVRPVGLAP